MKQITNNYRFVVVMFLIFGLLVPSLVPVIAQENILITLQENTAFESDGVDVVERTNDIAALIKEEETNIIPVEDLEFINVDASQNSVHCYDESCNDAQEEREAISSTDRNPSVVPALVGEIVVPKEGQVVSGSEIEIKLAEADIIGTEKGDALAPEVALATLLAIETSDRQLSHRADVARNDLSDELATDLYTTLLSSALDAGGEPVISQEASASVFEHVIEERGLMTDEETVFERFVEALFSFKTLNSEEYPIISVTAHSHINDQDPIVIPFEDLSFESGSVVLVIEPTRQFTPGNYTLEIDLYNPITDEWKVIEQDISWGVLAMNFDQDVYQVEDKAEVHIGFLDSSGSPICDASLNLSLIDPLGIEHHLEVQDTDTCTVLEVGNVIPDYRSHYQFTEAGLYTFVLTGDQDGEERVLKEEIYVKNEVEYVFSRHSATRNFPLGATPMSLSFYAEKAFTGTVLDYVPSSFDVENISHEGHVVSVPNTDVQVISWDVALQAGQQITVNYSYDAPNISPEFYTVGPAHAVVDREVKYKEARRWMIANDAAILKYAGPTAYDSSTAADTFSPLSVSGQETDARDLAFNDDGTKVYILGANGDDITEYSLSTAWDVSTGTSVDTLDVSSEETAPESMAFSADGTKVYVLGSNGDDINEYSLSTAWDVSTGSAVDTLDISGEETTPQGMAFSQDGMKVYVTGASGDDINEYSLSTAWDVSTGSAVDTLDVSGEESDPTAVTFNHDGTRVYVVGTNDDDITEYSLSTAWDVSTGTHVSSTSGLAGNDPHGLVFNNDGTRLYVIGPVTDAIDELTIVDGEYAEAVANDGSIDSGSVLSISLWGDTFQDTDADNVLDVGSEVVIGNVPAGLTAVMTLSQSDTVVTLTFTGNATSHQNVNDVSDITFDFDDTAFTSNSASVVTNSGSVSAYSSNIGINFDDNTAAPGGVSGNLQLWLKADADVTGTTNVTDWADQTSGNRDFTQATSGNQPAKTNDAMNFNPAITFDGTSDYLEDADGESYVNGEAAMTAFVAVNADSAANDGYIFITSNAATNTEAPWSLRFDDSGFESSRDDTLKTGINTGASDELYEADADNLTTNTNLITAVEWQSASSPVFYVDGKSYSSYTSPAQTGTLSGADYVRLGDDGNQEFWDGHIGEVLFYDVVLTATERQKIGSYLAIKYGTTLDQSSATNYIDSAGTVFWDASANSSYSNDIAGIGRDDLSELGQVKSISANSDAIVTMEAHGEGTNAVNSFSDIADNEFFVWGNDNGSLTEVSTNVHTGVAKRLERIWRVDETGDVGTINVSFDVSSLSVTGTGTEHFYLFGDSDTDFTSGGFIVPATSYASGVVTFDTVDFSDGDYFTLGTYSAAPGASLENLALWLKADAGLDESDGGSIDQWDDQSTNGRNALQATTANKPLYRQNATQSINGNPSVHFDGSNDTLGTSFDIGEDQFSDLSIFSVYVPDVDSAGAPFGNDDGGWDRFIIDASGVNNTVSTGAGGTPANNSQNTTGLFQVGVPTITTLIYDEDTSSGSIAAVNGKTELTYTAGHGPQSDSDFGLGFDGDDNYFDGRISELVVYGALKTTDQNKIESYLALKYGITLDQSTATSYVNGAGGEVFDANGNHDAYDNDIAGIITDSSSDLNQVTSKSINADAIVEVSSASSQDDGDSLVWGNDNGAVTETTSGIPTDVTKMLTRIWRVDETGDVGTVSMSFDVSALSVSGTSASDFHLIIDSDTNFTSGATILDAASFSANIVTFNSASITDNDYFTLGTDAGTLGIDIIDSGGGTVASPAVVMNAQNFSFTNQVSAGLLGTSSEKLRVENDTLTATWSLSAAATSTTAVWTDGSNTFDFNDATANAGDGGDADSVGGQLTVDASGATLTPEGGCTSTGLTLGSSSDFDEGLTDSITLLSAGSGADTGCYWDLTDIDLSQTLPAVLPAQSYTIDIVLTIV